MRRITLAFVAVLAAGSRDETAAGPINVVDRSVTIDTEAQIADFRVTFDRAPDFAANSFGQPEDQFQFFLDPASRTTFSSPDVTRSIVSLAGGVLIARDWPDGSDIVPIPYDLTGDTLTFSVSLATLKMPPDGFSFSLEWYYYGSFVADSPAAPEPSTLVLALIGFGGMGARLRRRGRNRPVPPA